MITQDVRTLLDYARAGNGVEYRPYTKLTKANAKKALFDSRTMWASQHVLSLWFDRRDKDFWRRFARNVEVVLIRDIKSEWTLGL